jgi:DNA-binding transcriptional LysR family regulator
LFASTPDRKMWKIRSRASELPKADRPGRDRLVSFRFDLLDLQLFLNVVEAGSITGGATRSHLSLAAASERIQGLESGLGSALLTRNRRGVVLTPAGQTLVVHARALLQQADRMRGDLAGFSNGLRGRIRLLCNSVANHEYLPSALGSFLVAHPHINIDLEERLGEVIVQAVADGVADIGIVEAATDTAQLQRSAFRKDRLVLVVPRGHVLVPGARGSRKVSIWAAESHDIIGLPEGSALQLQWDAAVARRGRRLNYRIRVPSFEAQCRLIGQGAGIALMPESAARRFGTPDLVRILSLTEPFFERELILCVRHLATLPLYARALVEHLREGG